MSRADYDPLPTRHRSPACAHRDSSVYLPDMLGGGGLGAWRRSWRRLALPAVALLPMAFWPDMAVADEATTIVGEFHGCEIGRVYPLANGKVLVCKSFFYHRDDAPEVLLIDEHSASIGGEIYEVAIEEAPETQQMDPESLSACAADSDAISAVEWPPDKCADFRFKRAAARRYWPEAYQVLDDDR